MKPASLGTTALLAALFGATAVLVTWPLCAHFTTLLPLGTVRVPTIALFNLWTLEWNANRVHHAYADYWNAPIFHPTPFAFALSEPQPLTGLAFALVRSFAGPVTAYNVILLAILIANGLAAFRLLRVMGAARLAAALAGVLTLALPYVLLELGVLQLTVLFPVLLCLAELCLLQREPARGTALRLATCIIATVLTCAYYAAFLSVFLALGALLLARRAHLRAWATALGAAALLAAAACAPVVIAQHRALDGFERPATSVRNGSASARRYWQADPRTLAAAVPVLRGRPDARNLYPGGVLCLLALGGFVAARRGPERRWVWLCVAGLGLALVMSFGRRLQLAGFIPYEWLFERAWPGFSRIRSPYRGAAFAQLFLVALAGLGLSALQRSSLHLRGRTLGPALAVLAVLFALAEVVPSAQALHAHPDAATQAPWTAWLRAHPGGAVVMAPPAKGPRVEDYAPTTLAMLQGLRHGHPLVNGYSGFFPRRARSGQAWQALRAVHEDASQVIFELGQAPWHRRRGLQRERIDDAEGRLTERG